jgi:hypothetical protein
LSVSIYNNIIEPGKKFLEEQKEYAYYLKKDHQVIESEYTDSVRQYEKSKSNFFYYAKIAEKIKFDYEIFKLNPNTSIEKREAYENKVLAAIEDAKIAEKNYQNYYKIVNDDRLKYIEANRNILRDFQQIDIGLNSFLKKMITNYVHFQKTNIKCNEFILETKLEVN